jgi:hypothetical protein
MYASRIVTDISPGSMQEVSFLIPVDDPLPAKAVTGAVPVTKSRPVVVDPHPDIRDRLVKVFSPKNKVTSNQKNQDISSSPRMS